MFDAKRFLQENFRSSVELVTFLRSYGVEPPLANTADKWWRRNSISGEWLPVLLAVLEIDRGAPVSIASYLTEGES